MGILENANDILELKTTFLQEAQQLLADSEQLFLRLENEGNDAQLLDALLRLSHNLKGSSRAVGFDWLGELTHRLESLLLKIKEGQICVGHSTIEFLLRCNDELKRSVSTLSSDVNAETKNDLLLQELDGLLSGNFNPEPTENFEKLGQLTSEALENKRQQICESSSRQSSQIDESIRVSLRRVDELINDVGELVILQTVLMEQKSLIQSTLLQNTIMQLTKLSKSLQEKSMSLRMVPMKPTFQKMQRIVRDTSSALQKEITLRTSGEDSEVDKTMVDQLSDPLVHLIRNACDHGLEDTEERIRCGKPRAGTVHLSAYHRSGNMVIEVKDDGGGINPNVIRKKAVEKGILEPGKEVTDSEAYQFIFHPGFSTKSEVTDISGRGVGLDVVKTNIERMKGSIRLETTPGQGTLFTITLPLTLAIIDAMVLKICEERYLIPSSQVVEIIQLGQEDIEKISQQDEVLKLRGETLALLRLDKTLGRSKSEKSLSKSVAIISGHGARSFAFLADAIIGKQQIVIKQLGKDMRKVQGISGGAILGDGRAALILDLNELVQSR